MGVVSDPTVEEDLGFRIGLIVAVFIRDEKEVWGSTNPDPAEPNFDAGEESAFVPKDFFGVVLAITIFVFEDEDAVFAFPLDPVGVGSVFYDPETAPGINSESNGLNNVGLPANTLASKPSGSFMLAAVSAGFW